MEASMKKRGTHTKADFSQSPDFYIELGVGKAHLLIQQVMDRKQVSQVELAQRMKLTAPAVSRLLDDERNLTVSKFSEILFHLNEEVEYSSKPIGGRTGLSKGIEKYKHMGDVIHLGKRRGLAAATEQDDDNEDEAEQVFG
jgi:transcriptional regulator with XRE-family HTH domain